MTALSMSAAEPAQPTGGFQDYRSVSVNKITNNISADRSVKQLAPGVSVVTTPPHSGKKHLQIIGDQLTKSVLSPKTNTRSIIKAAAPEGYVLYESFEDWDGADAEWTPDGWTVEMKGKVTDRDESWIPSAAGNWDPQVPDGKYYYKISWGSDDQDEWLESPYVTVQEGMDLSYWLFLDPAWLFMIDSEHIDWNTFEFIGEPEVAATLQIWAQVEGEDWVMLKDYADDYKNYSYRELAMMSPSDLEKKTVSLADYYGKKTRVAFRMVGYDGNEMFIDAIAIGYPTLDNVSYTTPIDFQYWGPCRSEDIIALDTPIGIYPVFEPITWTNENVAPNVKYTWTYDNADGEQATLTDADELTVTYAPNYTNETTAVNNFYAAPVLLAEADRSTPSQYQAPYTFVQAGGKPERMMANGTMFEATMLPFNLQELGLSLMSVDDSKIGDMSIPVFGYNVNANQYWLNYSLNDTPEEEGDYSHLIAIANLIWPTFEAPLVVNGVNIFGYGLIDDDAELTASICVVGADGSTDYETMERLVTKTIKGSDIIRQDVSKSYMCIPFDFDESAVLQVSDDVMAYFVMFEGFNSDKVSYFAPLQSTLPYPDYQCKGYIINHINLYNHTGRVPYYSTKTMRYVENGEYESCYGAFAMGLDAEYPWLTCETTDVVLPADGTAATVELGSYYDGSKLTVEAPEGVVASVTGRFDKCVLSACLAEGASSVNGNIVVKGPGVEVKIAVSGNAGIDNITVDNNAEVETIYDLSGRAVNPADAAPGVYVAKYKDGSARKLVVK